MMLFGYNFNSRSLRFQFRHRHRRWHAPLHTELPGAELSLIDVPAGYWAQVSGFSHRISCERQAHLQSYGLVAGYWVRVVQHAPVTILQVENLELALEQGLACEVWVVEIRRHHP
jgi:Fe2+ transport system protein FeoA